MKSPSLSGVAGQFGDPGDEVGGVPVGAGPGVSAARRVVYRDLMLPLVEAERAIRTVHYDPSRWQAYFENLYLLVKDQSPAKARMRQRR